MSAYLIIRRFGAKVPTNQAVLKYFVIFLTAETFRIYLQGKAAKLDRVEGDKFDET